MPAANAFGKGTLLTQSSLKEFATPPPGIDIKGAYYASGFAVSNGWYIQTPNFNGYSGGFGYFPSEEIMVVVYTTETEDPKSGGQAFPIVMELIKMITPENIVPFPHLR